MLGCPCRTLSLAGSLVVVLKLCSVGTNQESRAQAVVLRQERRAAPRDPPGMHGGMRLGWMCLVCHPQWESLVEGLCGVRVGLGAEPGGCSPRNMSTTLPFCALKETAFEICPSFRVSSWLP